MRLFSTLFLVLFASSFHLGLAWRPSWVPPLWDESCSFTREDALICAKKKVDTDHNELITREEVQKVFDNLPFIVRNALKLIVSVDSIFDGCDYDHNGVITPRDFRMSTRTCLPEKRYLCTAEWLCK